MLVTRTGTAARAKSGPVLKPDQVYHWSLAYDPDQGKITSTLGNESVTLPLTKRSKAEGASFDRFGVFTPAQGGQIVKVYFDDLTYTAGNAAAAR